MIRSDYQSYLGKLKNIFAILELIILGSLKKSLEPSFICIPTG